MVTLRHRSRDHLFPRRPFPTVLWNQASISNGFRDIQWRMVHVTLIRPLNKGQDRSFISNMRLPIGANSIFFLKGAPFSHNTYVTDDRRQT